MHNIHEQWTDEVREVLTTIPSFASRKSSPPWVFGLLAFVILSLLQFYHEEIIQEQSRREKKRNTYQRKIAKSAFMAFILELICCLFAMCKYGLQRLFLVRRREVYNGMPIIAFYCGFGYIPGERTPWHGDSLRLGIGGSEQCVIRLARALALCKKRKIIVYNACKKRCIVDGVHYIPTREFDPWNRYTHLIVWRLPQLLLILRIIMYYQSRVNKSTSFWIHDGANIEMLRQGGCLLRNAVRIALDATDSVVLPSYEMAYAQHMALFGSHMIKKKIPQLLCIPHGVPRYFEPCEESFRNPYWLLWPVSIERGLETLLRHLDVLQAACPKCADFRLFVCHRQTGYHDLPLPFVRIAEKDDRVILTGMLPPKNLALLYRRCSIFVFPCSVPEAFSLAVWECMSHGVVPIVYGLGALQNIHTVGAVVVSPGDEIALVKETSALLSQPEKLTSARLHMLSKISSERHDWCTVARVWERVIFKSCLTSPELLEESNVDYDFIQDTSAEKWLENLLLLKNK